MNLEDISIQTNWGAWMRLGEAVLGIGEPWRTDTMLGLLAYKMNVRRHA